MKKTAFILMIVLIVMSCIGISSVYADAGLAITSQNPGNIFADDESIVFSVSASGDLTGLTEKYIIICDETNETVWEKTEGAKEHKNII